MSNFDLSLTGAEINAALNKVHNPDATPINGSANVVTSDGVYDAVNDIQFANLNSSLVKTDISSGTNNTTLASSGAIKSYVDTVAGAQLSNALFSWSDGNSNADANVSGCTETEDSNGIASTNGSIITINSGFYAFFWQVEHYHDRAANNTAYRSTLSFRVAGTNITTTGTSTSYQQYYGSTIHGVSSGTFEASVYVDSFASTSYWRNMSLKIIKLL